MNQVKTGELIAIRRKNLGLTQKMLADRLDVSDRTISKWERGIGFPDISLIEPLADALGLSVLELLHGEEEPTDPQQDMTAREALQAIEPQIKLTVKQKQKWIVFLSMLIILLTASIPWLCISAQNKSIKSYNITSAEATSITPMILITRQDYFLVETLLKNDKVIQYYDQGAFDRGKRTTITLTEAEKSHYLQLIKQKDIVLKQEDIVPEFIIVEAEQDSLSVIYGTDYICVCLDYSYEEITKQIVICEYPYRANGKDLGWGKRHGNWIGLYNDNNISFQQHGYKTGWLEFFRTTYY